MSEFAEENKSLTKQINLCVLFKNQSSIKVPMQRADAETAIQNISVSKYQKRINAHFGNFDCFKYGLAESQEILAVWIEQ